MRIRVLAFLPALFIALGPLPGEAAQAVHADAIVHVTRVQPSHRFVQTERFELPYGNGADSLGFAPGGPERVAVGPTAFDVDAQGAFVVADPVRGKVFRIRRDATKPRLSTVGDLPLPFTDVAVDRDGKVHVADMKGRSMHVVGSSHRVALPGDGGAVRFVRHGHELVIRSGTHRNVVRGGKLLPGPRRVDVKKCNAEAGLVTLGPDNKKVQIEIGGPLASIRLVGVDGGGDTYLLIEQFRQRNRLEVDRRVVVIDSAYRLKATLDIKQAPAVHGARDFTLGPDGGLYRMVPGTQGVTFTRWEVR